MAIPPTSEMISTNLSVFKHVDKEELISFTKESLDSQFLLVTGRDADNILSNFDSCSNAIIRDTVHRFEHAEFKAFQWTYGKFDAEKILLDYRNKGVSEDYFYTDLKIRLRNFWLADIKFRLKKQPFQIDLTSLFHLCESIRNKIATGVQSKEAFDEQLMKMANIDYAHLHSTDQYNIDLPKLQWVMSYYIHGDKKNLCKISGLSPVEIDRLLSFSNGLLDNDKLV